MEGMEEREKGMRRKRDRKGSRSGSQREGDDKLREEGQRGGGDTGNQTQRGIIFQPSSIPLSLLIAVTRLCLFIIGPLQTPRLLFR